MRSIIRPLVHADYAAWKPLYYDYSSVWDEPMPEERFQRVWSFLVEPSHAAGGLGAEQDGKLVGFAHYMLYPCAYSGRMTCYLEDLYVHPKARRIGLARKLIETLKNKATIEDWGRIHWETRPENTLSKPFYEKIATRSNWVYYEISLGQQPKWSSGKKTS